ncbi:MAG TPA: phage major tail tube protein [Pseudomonas sp.]|uniref:phage major tail tube protein n=1 Tax=Stutzerimonas balearica TaxID=74829 RepID=UPI000C4FB083|nr:phage major tail tube protein [Phycisphaerae bacterium]HAF92357.1 phage major tail tube protein [Pseudomonas sp.]
MIPQVLTNMNLFVDGRSFSGRVTELVLPKLRRKTEEHRAGGMDGPVKMGMGMEMLDGSFKVTGVDRELLGMFGLADDTSFNGTFRGAYKDQKGNITPAVATLRGMLEELDMGSWVAGEKGESTFTLAPSYYKLEVDGQVVYEMDPLNCVRIINGNDEAAAERAAIGL